MKLSFVLMSLNRMLLSLEPEAKRLVDQARDPTRFV